MTTVRIETNRGEVIKVGDSDPQTAARQAVLIYREVQQGLWYPDDAEEWQCSECRRTFAIKWVGMGGESGHIEYCPQCGEVL